MFSFLKNYKLNRFMTQSNITQHPSERLDTHSIEIGYIQFFNPQTGQGRENYIKLIRDLYQQKDEKIRMKMLMFIHFLMKKNVKFTELFLDNYQSQFNGNVQNYRNKQSSYIFEREGTQKSKILSKIKTKTSVLHSVLSPTSNTIASINDQLQYSNIHNYLYLHIVVPYHSYLIRFASSQERYQHCKFNMSNQNSVYDSNECWKLLNIIKSVSNLRIPITHIGRYYKEQTLCVIDFIEFISEDLLYYKTQLEKQIQFAFQSYQELERTGLEGLLLQVEEVLKQNQNLYQIFRNRYFPEPKHKLQVRWFAVGEGSLQILQNFYMRSFQFPFGKEVHDSKFPQGISARSATTCSNSIIIEQ